MDSVPYILLALGLALVVQGGTFFVRAATGLAASLRVPHVVIGGTLMSLCTTAPEVVVSITSGLEGQSALALGNASGSVVCNIALIGGVTALLGTVVVHPRKLALQFGTLLGLCGLITLFSLDGRIAFTESAILIAIGVCYFVSDFLRGMFTPHTSEENQEALEVEKSHNPTQSMVWTVGLFVVGAVMVIGGSHLLVSNAVVIATNLGVSPLIVGLTIVAVGTSLPELVTAITSARQNVSDLAVGNILGANIANMTLVMGSAGVIYPIVIDKKEVLLNVPALWFFILLMWLTAVVCGRISKRMGALLVGLYAVYLLVLVTLS